MSKGFANHPSFKLPRVPAGRYVTVHLFPSNEDPLRYKGLFETSSCENMGLQNELYVLRRVQGPSTLAEFIKVPRHWQESGHLIVYELRQDEQYSVSKEAA